MCVATKVKKKARPTLSSLRSPFVALCGDGGFMSFDAPANSAEKLPAILISPGFSHVGIERV